MAEPPSDQTWLGAYYSGDATWDPYTEATTGVSTGQVDEILDVLQVRRTAGMDDAG